MIRPRRLRNDRKCRFVRAPDRPTAAPRPRRGGRPRDKKSLVASSEPARLGYDPRSGDEGAQAWSPEHPASPQPDEAGRPDSRNDEGRRPTRRRQAERTAFRASKPLDEGMGSRTVFASALRRPGLPRHVRIGRLGCDRAQPLRGQPRRAADAPARDRLAHGAAARLPRPLDAEGRGARAGDGDRGGEGARSLLPRVRQPDRGGALRDLPRRRGATARSSASSSSPST